MLLRRGRHGGPAAVAAVVREQTEGWGVLDSPDQDDVGSRALRTWTAGVGTVAHDSADHESTYRGELTIRVDDHSS